MATDGLDGIEGFETLLCSPAGSGQGAADCCTLVALTAPGLVDAHGRGGEFPRVDLSPNAVCRLGASSVKGFVDGRLRDFKSWAAGLEGGVESRRNTSTR